MAWTQALLQRCLIVVFHRKHINVKVLQRLGMEGIDVPFNSYTGSLGGELFDEDGDDEVVIQVKPKTDGFLGTKTAGFGTFKEHGKTVGQEGNEGIDVGNVSSLGLAFPKDRANTCFEGLAALEVTVADSKGDEGEDGGMSSSDGSSNADVVVVLESQINTDKSNVHDAGKGSKSKVTEALKKVKSGIIMIKNHFLFGKRENKRPRVMIEKVASRVLAWVTKGGASSDISVASGSGGNGIGALKTPENALGRSISLVGDISGTAACSPPFLSPDSNLTVSTPSRSALSRKRRTAGLGDSPVDKLECSERFSWRVPTAAADRRGAGPFPRAKSGLGLGRGVLVTGGSAYLPETSENGPSTTTDFVQAKARNDVATNVSLSKMPMDGSNPENIEDGGKEFSKEKPKCSVSLGRPVMTGQSPSDDVISEDDVMNEGITALEGSRHNDQDNKYAAYGKRIGQETPSNAGAPRASDFRRWSAFDTGSLCMSSLFIFGFILLLTDSSKSQRLLEKKGMTSKRARKKPFKLAMCIAVFCFVLPPIHCSDAKKKVSLATSEMQSFEASEVNSFDKDLEQLKELDGRLRRMAGDDSNGVDSVEILSEVRTVVRGYLSKINSVRMHIHDDDYEGAAASIRQSIGNLKTFSDMTQNDKNLARLRSSAEASENKLPVDDRNIAATNLASLDEIPDSQLALFIQPQASLFDDIGALAKDIVDGLDRMDLPTQSETFLFDTNPSEGSSFRSDSSGRHDGIFNDRSFPFQGVFHHQSSYFLPDMNIFLSDYEYDIVMEKHQIREAANDVCLPKCNVTEEECNCANLFGCIQNMTEFDLAVLTAGGFINTNKESDKHGEFNVHINDLNLFDSEDIREKLASVKELVGSSSSANSSQCVTVLENLHSACDANKDSCSQANQQSFQVTTDQVCNAVNNKAKLKFEAIGSGFDGFDDESSERKCEPLSFDLCAEFVVQFDRLYGGRNKEQYSHPNPMLKNTTDSLNTDMLNGDVFNKSQFPTGYTFEQLGSGVVSRTFLEDTFQGSVTLHGKAFSLVNAESKKALACVTVAGSADSRLVQIKYDKTDTSQQFKLNENDQLESLGCQGKVVTAMDVDDPNFQECVGGIGLRGDDPLLTSKVARQKWRFYDYGIVNVACGRSNGDLAITGIKDYSSLKEVPFRDHIVFSFVNPSNGMAITVGPTLARQMYRQNGVHVDGSWMHPSGNVGAYFKYNETEWKSYFGSVPVNDEDGNSQTRGYLAKQCRGRIEEWSGEVLVASAGLYHGNWYPANGRRDDGSQASGQWEANDYVVKRDEPCVVSNNLTGSTASPASVEVADVQSFDGSEVALSIGCADKCKDQDGKDQCEEANSVGCGSCNGKLYACTDSEGSIGDSSCNGAHYACNRIKKNVGDNSCNNGQQACQKSEGSIGDSSCNGGQQACYRIKKDVGNNSCNGEEACTDSEGSIGDSSCNAKNACKGIKVNVGKNACNGHAACYAYSGQTGIPDGCPSVNALKLGYCGCNIEGCYCTDEDGCRNGLHCIKRGSSIYGQCTEKGVGTPCTNENDCLRGHYCVKQVCQDGDNFSPCTSHDDCKPGYTCNSKNSKCGCQEPGCSCEDDGDCNSNTICDNGTGTCLSSFSIQLQKHGDNLPDQQFTITPVEAIPVIDDDKKKGVRIDGSWEHPSPSVETEKCAYFKFNMKEWEKHFGSFDSNEKVKVKRCRKDGTQEWVGWVDIFNTANYPPYGLRSKLLPEQSPACGQWEENDYVVKHDESCMVSKSELVKISSVRWPDHVLGLNGLVDADCRESPGSGSGSTSSASRQNDIRLLSGEQGLLDARKLWSIKDGAIENFRCQGYIIDIFGFPVGSQDGGVSPSMSILMNKKIGGWSQKWNAVSDDIVLTKAGDHSKWTVKFSEPGYDLALLPGFPGETIKDSSCLRSTQDRYLAKRAMRQCDESMSLLVGSKASVGRLKAIADLIEEKGPDRMPGFCCMDVATNSEFFGYDFDPSKQDATKAPMKCQNNSPWHLGISAEACEHAGGHWFRTPCVTLKETIDSRPSRFDLDAPMNGDCQYNLDRLETAYVSTSTTHANFTFTSDEGNDVDRCAKFCQSLPDYHSQNGMMIEHQTVMDEKNSIADAESCTCLYPNNNLPLRELLPKHAVASLPTFALINSLGMALGLRPNVDCFSDDDLMIETQVRDPNSPRQQFQRTHDGRIVSVRCPERALSIELPENDQCSPGAGLQVSKALVGLTASPTASPTSSPSTSASPTNIPTASPTSSPTTAAPTPNPTASPTASPTTVLDALRHWYQDPSQGWCIPLSFFFSSADPPARFYTDNLFPSDQEDPQGICFKYCEPYMTRPGFLGMQWEFSHGGRCTCHFGGSSWSHYYFDRPDTSVYVSGSGNGPVTGNGAPCCTCYPIQASTNNDVPLTSVASSLPVFDGPPSDLQKWYFNGVRVDGSYVQSFIDGGGEYFKYNEAEWDAYFDYAVPSLPAAPGEPESKTYDVKQCREGMEVWSGIVQIWTAGYHRGSTESFPPIGRHFIDPALGQWEANDYVVKYDETCASSTSSTINPTTTAMPTTSTKPSASPSILPADLQKWTFSDNGNIANVACPDLIISSSKEKDVSLDTVYFALQNPRTQLAMGAVGTVDDCNAGRDLPLQLQELVPGSPNQQFVYKDGKLYCMLCAGYAIQIPDDDCAADLRLSSYSQTNNAEARFEWRFHNGTNETGRVESAVCSGMFITVGGATSGEVQAAAENPTASSFAHPSSALASFPGWSEQRQLSGEDNANADELSSHASSPELSLKDERSFDPSPKSDNNTSLDTTSYNNTSYNATNYHNSTTYGSANYTTSANYTRAETPVVEWKESTTPTVGSPAILSNYSTGRYQKWSKIYQVFRPLMGPFSLVNPNNGRAITVEDGDCTNGMRLKSELDDDSNEKQKWYLGKHGSIFSLACRGLVIATENSTVKLQTFRRQKNNMKWKLKNGNIESVMHKDMVLGTANMILTLQQKSTGSTGQRWRRINTRLMNSNNGLTWRQAWTVAFIEPGFNKSAMEEVSRSDQDGLTTCFRASQAFSASFDDFAKGLVIKDAGNEEQCRKTREGMGFDKDHPFDTEVRDKFHEHQCNPFFTGVDHKAVPPAMEGPPKFEMVEYTPIEYEAAEYPEDVEYAEAEHEDTVYEADQYSKAAYTSQETFGHLEYDEFKKGDGGTSLRVGQEWPKNMDKTPPVDGQASEYLNDIQDVWLITGHAMAAAEHLYTYNEDTADNVCEAMGPENVCAGVGCVTNPLRITCQATKLISSSVAFVIMFGATIAYHVLDHWYEKETLGPNKVAYTYEYSKATYKILGNHTDWNFQAMNAMKENMLAQHTEMKRQIQERHKEMTNHLGNDITETRDILGKTIVTAQNALGKLIVDAQNALGIEIRDSQNNLGNYIVDAQNANGKAIVGAQNALGNYIVDSQNAISKDIVDSQNALGNIIVDAQNANGEAVVDARNAMSTQHNVLGQWLHKSLCLIYEGHDGTCEAFVGPLPEDQAFTPMELHWPEGQSTMAERMKKIERAISAIDDGNDGDVKEVGTKETELEAIKDEIIQVRNIVESRVERVESKVDSIQQQMQKLMDIVAVALHV